MKSASRVERESVVTRDKSIGKNERLERPWRKSEFNVGQLLLWEENADEAEADGSPWWLLKEQQKGKACLDQVNTFIGK